MKAFWTNTALVTLGQIIIYLEDEWSVQEILDFMDQVDKCVGLLEANPELGRVYNFTHFRQLLVVRQVYFSIPQMMKKTYLSYMVFGTTTKTQIL